MASLFDTPEEVMQQRALQGREQAMMNDPRIQNAGVVNDLRSQVRQNRSADMRSGAVGNMAQTLMPNANIVPELKKAYDIKNIREKVNQNFKFGTPEYFEAVSTELSNAGHPDAALKAKSAGLDFAAKQAATVVDSYDKTHTSLIHPETQRMISVPKNKVNDYYDKGYRDPSEVSQPSKDGTQWVQNKDGSESRLVTDEEAMKLTKEGWSKYSPKTKEGYQWVQKGDERKYVTDKEAASLSVNGWTEYKKETNDPFVKMATFNEDGSVKDSILVRSSETGDARTNGYELYDAKTVDLQDAIAVINTATGKSVVRFDKNLTPAQQIEQKENIKASAKRNEQKLAFLADDIEVLDYVAKNTSGWTSGMGSLLRFVAGSPAKDLAASLDELKGGVAFNRLSEMKESSKTGGALGQIAVREIELLQSQLGNLDQNQSPERLKSNIARIKDHYTRIQEALNGINPDTGEVWGWGNEKPKKKMTEENSNEVEGVVTW